MNMIKRMKRTGIVLAACIVGLTPSRLEAGHGNWNQFRGPEGNGISGMTGLPLEISDSRNIKWATPIHDKGWSSPVVWGNQVWLTTANTSGTELYALCVDLDSGNIIHDINIFDSNEPQREWPEQNSHASPTPVIEEGRIYIHFGSYGTACLDTATGEKVWERRDLKVDHRVRAASSPIVDGDLIFLTFDGVDKQFIAALNKHNGDTVWKKDRKVNSDFAKVLEKGGVKDAGKVMKQKANDNRKSYATPTVIEHKGTKQLISPAAEVTISYDPESGEELWRVRHDGWGWNVTSRPIYAHGMVYLTTGISKYILAVDPSGSGDVTDSHIRWKTKRGVSHIPSPLIIDDLIFMVGDSSGMVTCLEAKTGKEIYRERLGGFHNYWASPIYANDKIYLFSREGKITVLAPGREFKILSTSQLDTGFFASAAVTEKGMVLRSQTNLYLAAKGFNRTEKQIASLKTKPTGKAASVKKPAGNKNAVTDLGAYGEKLKDMVKAGDLTPKQAIARYKLAEQRLNGEKEKQVADKKDNGKDIEKNFSSDLEEYGRQLKKAIEDGILTDEEATRKWEEAIAKLKGNAKSSPNPAAKGKGKGKIKAGAGKKGKMAADKNGATNFYAIVIGKLRTRDIELGEFTMKVDHVTSTYGNEWVKDEIVGKTVKVTGVSGKFRDNLLLLKRGDTLKVRSGSYDTETGNIGFGFKFHVLEKTKPFNPDDFGIPPREFRGFEGVIEATTVELGGYEAVLKVDKIVSVADSSKAKNPEVIVGKLIRMNGFFSLQEKYDDLHVGDRIRVGARHGKESSDSFGVTRVLEKIQK